ncbi:MAG TPA: RpiB/LacA/LacB family sugar-phosphate isomerase [Candidatus Gracilibacteria bacterium]|nr:RpiB/LacA/LacB family sugar-phosphate isomerase [Candidatus Gracilibacteria bacterium]
MHKIWIGSDHAGYELKEWLKTQLPDIDWQDLGSEEGIKVDYPIIAHSLCQMIQKDTENRLGILICGTGIGMSIAANKHKNIRAALAYNESSARLAREHNKAQILCLGAREISSALALNMVIVFLNAQFQGERHEMRINEIEKLH